MMLVGEEIQGNLMQILRMIITTVSHLIELVYFVSQIPRSVLLSKWTKLDLNKQNKTKCTYMCSCFSVINQPPHLQHVESLRVNTSHPNDWWWPHGDLPASKEHEEGIELMSPKGSASSSTEKYNAETEALIERAFGWNYKNGDKIANFLGK